MYGHLPAILPPLSALINHDIDINMKTIKYIFVAAVVSLVCIPIMSAHAQLGQEYRLSPSNSPKSAQEIPPAPKKPDPNAKKSLDIEDDSALTFPIGMTECNVFTSGQLESAVLKSDWKGTCEWIIVKGVDSPMIGAYEIKLDKPLVIEVKHPDAVGHPLVITNDTGRAVVFKTPKDGGCAVIMRRDNAALMGFTFEGALCGDNPAPKKCIIK